VRIKLDFPHWWYLQSQESNKLDDPSCLLFLGYSI
jgi:phospholipid-translocating ATPase